MSAVMIVYYLISAFVAGLLVWNLIREKKSVNDMILYLLVLVPLVLRLLRVK
jgi:uncharacterized membrane protein YbjE (DUF340 family)